MSRPIERRPVSTVLVDENVGSVLGTAKPCTIRQEMINDFARVTRDLQWIHVDPKQAATGPYGSTVAHGYLILSLLPSFTRSVIDGRTAGSVINYGLDRVRFVGPAQVDRAVVDEITLASLTPKQSGLLVGLSHEVTDTQSGRQICVARTLSLYAGMQ